MAHDELIKITVRIRKADYDSLCEMFPQPVGYNLAIRQIVQTQVKILLEKINKQTADDAAASEAEIASVRLEKESSNVGITTTGLDPQQGDGPSAK